MKKIKLNKLEVQDSTLTREQLKGILGGSNDRPCDGKTAGASCSWSGKTGKCISWPITGGLICWVSSSN